MGQRSPCAVLQLSVPVLGWLAKVTALRVLRQLLAVLLLLRVASITSVHVLRIWRALSAARGSRTCVLGQAGIRLGCFDWNCIDAGMLLSDFNLCVLCFLELLQPL